MKTPLAIIISVFSALALFAAHFTEFTGWDDLIRQSPDIIIARRIATSQPAIVGSTNQLTAIAIVDGLIE
jgi:hypothetical protein